DPARTVSVPETFHEQTDDELSKAEVKQIEADDQAIQTILLGLPEDIYAAVDSCETAQEIWLHVQQMMKGSNIGIQEKKAKLFNEWERFTSTDGESIKSYYHRFSKLMNDFKRNKHFPEKIATDYTQLYDFLKYNQKEVNKLRAKRLEKSHDPLALMATSNYPVFHQDQPSPSTYIQQPLPNNNYNPQPSFTMDFMQQPMPNPEDISDPTTAMNMALALMAKAFKLNYSTPTNNNQRISSNPRNRQIAQPVRGNGRNQYREFVGNQNGYNAVQNVGNQVVQNAVQNPGVQNGGNQNGIIVVPGIANQNVNQIRNGNVVAARAEGNVGGNNGNQIRCYNYRGLGHLARNCTARPRRRDATYLQTQLRSGRDRGNKAPVYDSDGSAENDSNVISDVPCVEQNGGTVEQCPASDEETRALYDSLYNNLAIEVEKVNSVNRNLKASNAELTTELARYKNQEKCFEISQDKYDKLERCYQQSVYQEQCLTKKINALHLSSGKQITALNEEISNLNKQLSMEKSTVSSLLEEKKRLKSDFKIREDELLDKHILLENKIKELDNILVKMGQSIQTMHMLSPKPDSQEFLLDKHDPPVVHDSEETLQLAQRKTLEREIDRLLKAVVSQEIMSVVQNNSVVDTSNLQTEPDRTKERFENCIIQKDNEYAKLWNEWHTKCKECKYDKILYDKAYNDMHQKIERLQAQLGDLKGKCEDTPGVSHTLDPLSQKLENENVELEFQVVNYLRAQLFAKVSEQKDTIRGTSVNNLFAKQSILGKPPSYSSKSNLYSVTPLPKSSVLPKVDKTNALSKPVTSNSIPAPQESKVVKDVKVIAPGMFKINPSKTSRE
ncbi:hypothetical protein Tco_0986884, partial [Tanacetum coccineum]